MSQDTQCVVCKEKIKQSAIKCTHCDSYQNWRRHLGLSSSLLSIIVALFSVLTVFVTVITIAIKEDDSKIHFSVLNIRGGMLTYMEEPKRTFIVEIFVTNSGNAAGAIKSFFIKLPGSDKYHDMVLTPKKNAVQNIAPTTLIIEPGKSEIVAAQLMTGDEKKMYSDFSIKAEMISFKGDNQIKKIVVKNFKPSYAR